MNKWLKRAIACGFLSVAVFGGTASAAWCGKPCQAIYNNCIANGSPESVCQTKFEVCMAAACSES